MLVTFERKEYKIEKNVLYLYNEINETTMTTKTYRRLLETVQGRLFRVIETSRMLDILSEYDVEKSTVLDEYNRHLRMLESALSELDYARDIMTEAVKDQKRQIKDIEAM